MNNTEKLGLVVGGLLVALGVHRITKDIACERDDIRLARLAAGEASYQRKTKSNKTSISVD
jgi:hypothetical protein